MACSYVRRKPANASAIPAGAGPPGAAPPPSEESACPMRPPTASRALAVIARASSGAMASLTPFSRSPGATAARGVPAASGEGALSGWAVWVEKTRTVYCVPAARPGMVWLVPPAVSASRSGP